MELAGVLVIVTAATLVGKTVAEGTKRLRKRDRHQDVRIEIDGDELRVSGQDDEEQDRLVKEWLARHGGSQRIEIGDIKGTTSGVAIGHGGHAHIETRAPKAKGVPTEWMPAVISAILLVACLFVLLSANYNSSTENWASGCIGAIVGFWLSDKGNKG
jgi:hypothetical protein